MAGAVQSEKLLAAKFAAVLPHLDERQRRLVLGAEARSLGHGGIKAVAAAAGTSAVTVSKGVAELESGDEPLGRTRRPGGGRKPVTDTDPGVTAALLALVEPTSRGDPESPLRWTTKSVRRLAEAMSAAGHKVSPPTVAKLLKAEGFQPAGQCQDGRGRGASGPRRPVRLPQRPSHGPPRHRRPGDQRGHQEEGTGRGLQERWPGVAAQRHARAGQGPRLHRPHAGQGHPVRGLRRGRQHRVGVGGLRPRHGRLRGEHHRTWWREAGKTLHPNATRL